MSTRRIPPARAPERDDAATKTVTPGAAVARFSPLGLATLVAPDGARWRVRVGAREHVVDVDPCVDPALLREACAGGARVVVSTDEHVIVGLLQTARGMTIGRDGAVAAKVTRFDVEAAESATLRTGAAFVRVLGDEVETYGVRVIARARELAKILGRMVKIN